MKRIYIIITFLLFTSYLYPQATSLEWVKNKKESWGQFLRKDFENNLIVCGKQGAGYRRTIVVKYDTSGNELWQQIFNDSTFSGDNSRPSGMEVDGLGNIYITGITNFYPQDTAPKPQVLLLKYSKNGALLWNRKYGLADSLVGSGTDLKVFDNRRVYISTIMSTTYFNSTIHGGVVCYDSSGTFLWAQNDTNFYESQSESILSDNNGNCYAVNLSGCCPPGYKMSVTKFDSLGNQKWFHPILDSAYYYGDPNVTAIDDSANIYIVGTAAKINSTTGYDCAVAKLDSSGNQKWFSVYNSSPSSSNWEIGKDIDITKEGELFVCGYIDGSPTYKPIVFKLGTNGNLDWSYFGSYYTDLRSGVVYDSLNYIAVGTYYLSSVNTGTAILNFNKITGALSWTNNYLNEYGIFNLESIGSALYVSALDVNNGSIYDDDSLTLMRFNYDVMNKVTPINRKALNEVHISPNPCHEKIVLTFNEPIQGPLFIKVTNALDIVICENELPYPYILNMDTWSAGLYFISTTIQDKFYIKKVIKL